MKVKLRPIISKINLPTVITTAILPLENIERLFIATQVGEIFCIGKTVETFLDISSNIIKLGESSGGYDERGLLGLAFHPNFNYNGLFYLHYSLAGSEGIGALPKSFKPDPCDPTTLNLKWADREINYDHVDTVEEWILNPSDKPKKHRTLLNLRRPFSNHNGVNSLNFSPENGKLILTTGDGGSGYDPFNLSQSDLEIAGKIIEIDVNKNVLNHNPPIVTRFEELPESIQECLTVIAKGVRNISGISFQKFYNGYIKYIGNVGQNLVESIFAFVSYKSVMISELTHGFTKERLINIGWRGWEGDFPTSEINTCTSSLDLNNKVISYYDEAVKISAYRLRPLINYFHEDSRFNKFSGTAITGVKPYMGSEFSDLKGCVVFIDLAKKENSEDSVKGVLAYTKMKAHNYSNDFNVIEVDYDFGSQPAYYTCLGTNLTQTRLFLGVYGSMKVADFNQGTIFEIIP